jgi:hypothetical protein
MDYLYINKADGVCSDSIEIIEMGDNILLRHTTGVNSENYILAQQNGLQVKFSVVDIEGMYYVSINNEHVLDYKKFMLFECVKNIGRDTVIEYVYTDDIVIKNCNVFLIHKMIDILQDNLKKKIGMFYNIKYYMKSILV